MLNDLLAIPLPAPKEVHDAKADLVCQRLERLEVNDEGATAQGAHRMGEIESFDDGLVCEMQMMVNDVGAEIEAWSRQDAVLLLNGASGSGS